MVVFKEPLQHNFKDPVVPVDKNAEFWNRGIGPGEHHCDQALAGAMSVDQASDAILRLFARIIYVWGL